MINRKLVGVVAAVAACASLTVPYYASDAASISSDELFTKMYESLEGVESVKGGIVGKVNVSLDEPESGTKLPINIDMNIDFEGITNKASKVNMMMDMDMMGQEQNMNLDVYVDVDKEAGTGYMYQNDGSGWTAEAVDMSEFEEGKMEEAKDQIKAVFDELGGELSILEGDDSYTVNYVITGDELMEFAQKMGEGEPIEIPDGVDLSVLAINFMGEVDKETFLPSEFDLSASYAGSIRSEDIGNFDINVNDAFMQLFIPEYNTVEDIEIPEEAKKAAENIAPEETVSIEDLPSSIPNILNGDGEVSIDEEATPDAAETKGTKLHSDRWGKDVSLTPFDKMDDIYAEGETIFGFPTEYISGYPNVYITIYDDEYYTLGEAKTDMTSSHDWDNDYYNGESDFDNVKITDVIETTDSYGNPMYIYGREYHSKSGDYTSRNYIANIEMPEGGYISVTCDATITEDDEAEYLNDEFFMNLLGNVVIE